MIIFHWKKICNFVRSRMTKRTLPLDSSRKILTQENFVEFRDSQIFTKFEVMGVVDWTSKMRFLEKSRKMSNI